MLGCLTDSSSYEVRRFLPARTGGQQLVDMNSYLNGFHFRIVSIQPLNAECGMCTHHEESCCFFKKPQVTVRLILLCKDSFANTCIESRTLRHNLKAELFHQELKTF